MTPCERLGYKVGDAFVMPYNLQGVKKGDIVYLQGDDGTILPYFGKTKNQISPDICLFIEYEDENRIAKPYKPRTEAEERGAKFGALGVTFGERIVFQREDDAGFWYCFDEKGKRVQQYHPIEIRLDHETEHKYIPYNEAPDVARRIVSNLWYKDSAGGVAKVSEVHRYEIGIVGYTFANKCFSTDTDRLFVRVPA